MTEILEELRALMGLKICDGIGDITANKLISACGSATAVFEEKKQHLSHITGIPSNVHELLRNNIDWIKVDKEISFIEKHNINTVSVLDKEYPTNLLKIDRAPLLLFFKGNIEKLSLLPCISVVGTRMATGYGIDAVDELIAQLKDVGICIISGLARGIDIAAHSSSLHFNVPTFGVVAHGLKTIYPSDHRTHAIKMIEGGGAILTEFLFEEIPNRENFPKRNRIIAGLSKATIVIEAAKKGGALITAELALGYSRKVFVLPGRYNDKYSEGCNALIKSGKVISISSFTQLIEELGFKKTAVSKQSSTPSNLSSVELSFIQILRENSKITLDNISSRLEKNISDCSAILFNLEMQGIVRSLPGKAYELC